MSSIDAVTRTDFCDKNATVFPIKDKPIVTDAKTIDFTIFSHDRTGKIKRISTFQVGLQFLNDSALDISWKPVQLPPGMGGEPIGGHSPRWAFTESPETLPEARDAFSDLRKAGLNVSMSSIVSSNSDLSSQEILHPDASATAMRFSNFSKSQEGSLELVRPAANALGFQVIPRSLRCFLSSITSPFSTASLGLRD